MSLNKIVLVFYLILIDLILKLKYYEKIFTVP